MTKIRALYQRAKGRDLFDIWLALTYLKLDPLKIASVFPVYRPQGVTRDDIVENLCLKLKDLKSVEAEALSMFLFRCSYMFANADTT